MSNLHILPAAAIAAGLAMTSPRRLYWDADEENLVEEGDPAAAFLAVAEGSQTNDPRVIKFLGGDIPDDLERVESALTPQIKPVEKEQAPTVNQLAHEAVSVTSPSIAEAVAESAKAQAQGKSVEALQTSAVKAEAADGDKAVKAADDKAVKPDADKASKPGG